MSTVLVAVFTNHAAAERMRTRLVRDGFPSDRVDVTSKREPGRAAVEPGSSAHERYLQYFSTLFNRPEERAYAERLAHKVERGGATVTVLPRGRIEVDRARSLLKHAAPREIDTHDLAWQGWEHAAARHEHPWVSAFWIENRSHAHCLYCQLFEDDSLERAQEASVPAKGRGVAAQRGKRSRSRSRASRSR